MSISLKPYNTFGIDAFCKKIIFVNSENDLLSFLEHNKNKKFRILGGGSNVLFTSDIDFIVLINQIKGIEVTTIDENTVSINVGSGENWHNFVMWCADRKYCGIENLALQPISLDLKQVKILELMA